MAGVFISYRRDDTAGEATHLAADLSRALGRDGVFIDIDTISAGVDFVERIDDALAQCEFVLVLIGDRWLEATDASGARRLDDEQDFVRLEVASALKAPDVTVVPVLVEGGRMPAASALPAELAELSRINALDLTSKRWRYDVGQIIELIGNRGWRGALRRLPAAVKIGVPLAVAVAAVALAVVLGGDSSPSAGSSPKPEGQLSQEAVGQVSQGTSVDDAIEVFGPPDDRKEVPGCELNTADPPKVQLSYNLPDGSLIVYFDATTAEMISYTTTSPRFPTYRGDRVGDQFASLEATWGTALKYLPVGSVVEPPADHSGYWEVKDTARSKLLFTVRADQVKSISGGFLPACE